MKKYAIKVTYNLVCLQKFEPDQINFDIGITKQKYSLKI